MSLWLELMVAGTCAAGAAAQGQGLFLSPPQVVVANAFAPALSGDELTMVFSSTRTGGLGGFDLYETRRVDLYAAWSSPANLTSLNSALDDDRPALSNDGLELYFASSRPGGPGSTNIGVARRSSPTAPWSAPVLLPAPVNMMGVSTTDPALSPDALKMWFAASGSSGGDIFTVERASRTGAWGNRQPFSVANGTFRDFAPHAESDGIVYFASERSTSTGPSDIFLTWTTGPTTWATPVAVSDLNNTGAGSHAAIGKRTGRAYVSTGTSPSFTISAWCPPRDPPDNGGLPGSIEHLPVVGGGAPYIVKVYSFRTPPGSMAAIDWNNWRTPPPPDDGFLFLAAGAVTTPLEFPLPRITGAVDINPGLVFLTLRYAVPVGRGPVPTHFGIPGNPSLSGLVVSGQLLLLERATLNGALSHVVELRL